MRLSITLNVILEQKWSDPDASEADDKERRTSDSSELVEDGGNRLWSCGSCLNISYRRTFMGNWQFLEVPFAPSCLKL